MRRIYFSVDADRALPVAESLAERIGARLDVVSLPSAGIDPVYDMGEARAHARRMGVDVASIHIRHDQDVVGGVRATRADDDALLCCAPHARGRLGERVFHSVSADIVRRSTDPLVLVGPAVRVDPRPGFTEILACVDGSPLTPRIAAVAARWGRALGVKVRMYRAVPDRIVTASAWSTLVRLASTLTSFGVDVVPEAVAADDAADAILRAAGELASPMVAIGAHARAERAHPALGRVSLAVVRDSPFPVLVVPAPRRG